MSASRIGVFCAVLVFASVALAGNARALGAPVTFSATPTSTPANLSQTPKDCTAAIQRALGKTSDGLVSTYFTDTQLANKAVLATCYGAVLRAGKTPSSNIADYQCVGRSGNAYIVGGSRPNITVETSADASRKLLPNQCSIAVCNGAKGTVKVCSPAKSYDGGVSLSPDGGLTTTGNTILSPELYSQTPVAPLSAGTPANGTSIIGQLFNPTPLAEQKDTIAPSAQNTNDAFEQAAQSGLTKTELTPTDFANNPVLLKGGTPPADDIPTDVTTPTSDASKAQGEVQTVNGSNTFPPGSPQTTSDTNEEACSGFWCSVGQTAKNIGGKISDGLDYVVNNVITSPAGDVQTLSKEQLDSQVLATFEQKRQDAEVTLQYWQGRLAASDNGVFDTIAQTGVDESNKRIEAIQKNYDAYITGNLSPELELAMGKTQTGVSSGLLSQGLSALADKANSDASAIADSMPTTVGITQVPKLLWDGASWGLASVVGVTAVATKDVGQLIGLPGFEADGKTALSDAIDPVAKDWRVVNDVAVLAPFAYSPAKSLFNSAANKVTDLVAGSGVRTAGETAISESAPTALNSSSLDLTYNSVTKTWELPGAQTAQGGGIGSDAIQIGSRVTGASDRVAFSEVPIAARTAEPAIAPTDFFDSRYVSASPRTSPIAESIAPSDSLVARNVPDAVPEAIPPSNVPLITPPPPRAANNSPFAYLFERTPAAKAPIDVPAVRTGAVPDTTVKAASDVSASDVSDVYPGVYYDARLRGSPWRDSVTGRIAPETKATAQEAPWIQQYSDWTAARTVPETPLASNVPKTLDSSIVPDIRTTERTPLIATEPVAPIDVPATPVTTVPPTNLENYWQTLFPEAPRPALPDYSVSSLQPINTNIVRPIADIPPIESPFVSANPPSLSAIQLGTRATDIGARGSSVVDRSATNLELNPTAGRYEVSGSRVEAQNTGAISARAVVEDTNAVLEQRVPAGTALNTERTAATEELNIVQPETPQGNLRQVLSDTRTNITTWFDKAKQSLFPPKTPDAFVANIDEGASNAVTGAGENTPRAGSNDARSLLDRLTQNFGGRPITSEGSLAKNISTEASARNNVIPFPSRQVTETAAREPAAVNSDFPLSSEARAVGSDIRSLETPSVRPAITNTPSAVKIVPDSPPAAATEISSRTVNPATTPAAGEELALKPPIADRTTFNLQAATQDSARQTFQIREYFDRAETPRAERTSVIGEMPSTEVSSIRVSTAPSSARTPTTASNPSTIRVESPPGGTPITSSEISIAERSPFSNPLAVEEHTLTPSSVEANTYYSPTWTGTQVRSPGQVLKDMTEGAKAALTKSVENTQVFLERVRGETPIAAERTPPVTTFGGSEINPAVVTGEPRALAVEPMTPREPLIPRANVPADSRAINPVPAPAARTLSQIDEIPNGAITPAAGRVSETAVTSSEGGNARAVVGVDNTLGTERSGFFQSANWPKAQVETLTQGSANEIKGWQNWAGIQGREQAVAVGDSGSASARVASIAEREPTEAGVTAKVEGPLPTASAEATNVAQSVRAALLDDLNARGIPNRQSSVIGKPGAISSTEAGAPEHVAISPRAVAEPAVPPASAVPKGTTPPTASLSEGRQGVASTNGELNTGVSQSYTFTPHNADEWVQPSAYTARLGETPHEITPLKWEPEVGGPSSRITNEPQIVNPISEPSYSEITPSSVAKTDQRGAIALQRDQEALARGEPIAETPPPVNSAESGKVATRAPGEQMNTPTAVNRVTEPNIQQPSLWQRIKNVLTSAEEKPVVRVSGTPATPVVATTEKGPLPGTARPASAEGGVVRLADEPQIENPAKIATREPVAATEPRVGGGAAEPTGPGGGEVPPTGSSAGPGTTARPPGSAASVVEERPVTPGGTSGGGGSSGSGSESRLWTGVKGVGKFCLRPGWLGWHWVSCLAVGGAVGRLGYEGVQSLTGDTPSTAPIAPAGGRTPAPDTSKPAEKPAATTADTDTKDKPIDKTTVRFVPLGTPTGGEDRAALEAACAAGSDAACMQLIYGPGGAGLGGSPGGSASSYTSPLANLANGLKKLFGGSGNSTPNATQYTPPKPVITLIANPHEIAAGRTVQLAWSSVGMRQCGIFDAADTRISSGTEGTIYTGALATTSIFTAACTTTTGATSTATTTILVQ